MRKSTKDAVWAITALLLTAVGCGITGHFDHQDAIICEMKNNGAYWELSEQHPQATDAELIKLYKQEEETSEQCPD